MFKRPFTWTVSLALSTAVAGDAMSAIPRAAPQQKAGETYANGQMLLIQAAPGNNNPAPSTPSTNSNTSSSGTTGISDGNPELGRTGLNWLITHKIQKDVDAVVDECGNYEPVYRIDCLREGFLLAAKSLPNTGEYRKVRQILLDTSNKLGRIVTRYQDVTAPSIRSNPDSNRRFKQRRRYRAVKKDKVNEALAQAQRVIEEAQTQLLRSSENSQARLAHYQTIATAVGSSKVLLRST